MRIMTQSNEKKGEQTTQKNKTTAAVLAFFLGGFGFQWIYLGSLGKMFASLLFFWTGIPALIALYHTFTFLLMSDADFDRKYNR